MNPYKIETIILPITPRQLRELADKLEKEMGLKTIGDGLPSRYYGIGNLRVSLMADQEAYFAYQAGGKPGCQEWI